MFAIKLKKRYIFPDRFPFTLGRDGDIPFNTPYSLRFDIEKGKPLASSDGTFTINNSPVSISVVKPGDRINFCGIEMKIEKKFIATLRAYLPAAALGFAAGALISLSLAAGKPEGKKVNGEKVENCYQEALQFYERARNNRKILSPSIKSLEGCISFLSGTPHLKEREELIKHLGALRSLQEEEFRRLKFEAEKAIREGDISSALQYLEEIKRLIDDPSDVRWKYAVSRMREIAR